MTQAQRNNSLTHKLLLISGIGGFLGVTLGAFGAHALKPDLEAMGMIDLWKTAVFYQMVHVLGLFALAIWAKLTSVSRLATACAWLWCLGIVLFSGSLYLIALGGPGWLGPVTPLGGLCFLAGWALLAIMGLKKQTAE